MRARLLMLVAVVSAAGVLALRLLPIALGCGALSIAYCLCVTERNLARGGARGVVPPALPVEFLALRSTVECRLASHALRDGHGAAMIAQPVGRIHQWLRGRNAPYIPK